ncbi:MAG: ABC transporter ATP-binding protein [Saprospiraceae bacterium]|nr:ABC transporter ATP-binding protein [Saprospiraceae bacterium]
MEVIATQSLCKFFGKVPATDHISIHVKQGEIYGFLGLNGAGKTTLIRILLGMIQPDQGNVYLFGKKLTPKFEGWNDVGYLVETPFAYPELSVTENLKVYHALRGLNDPASIGRIIDRLKLTPYAHTTASALSLGNQQRLGLAKALLHRPKLLILDEPINGLDPEGIVEVRELLLEMAEQGATIFLSSHILGEISKVANRFGIIHRGKLIRELTVPELKEQLVKKVLIQTRDNRKALACLADGGYTTTLSPENEIAVGDPAAIAHPEKLSALLAAAGMPPIKIVVETEDLEMYFLRTIKNHDNT